jgi:hypothetical protein
MSRSVAEGRVTRLIRNLARKLTCSATSQFRPIWGFAFPYMLELVGNWLVTNEVWFWAEALDDFLRIGAQFCEVTSRRMRFLNIDRANVKAS